MKLLSLLAFLFTLSASAQADTHYGILGGLNFGTFHDHRGTSDSAPRLMAGVYAEIPWMNHLSFAPQLRFDQKGGHTYVPEAAVDVAIRDIEIPLYVKYRFLEKSGFTPYGFIGPAVAFKVASSTTASGATGLPVDATGLGEANTVDVSIDAGVGADFSLTEKLSLNVNLAYSLGLTNAYDLYDLNNIGVYGEKARSFQFYLGLGCAY